MRVVAQPRCGNDRTSNRPNRHTGAGSAGPRPTRPEKPKDFGSVGIGGGQRVYTVHYQDLAAIVSDTPLVIYDPTREHVLAHEFVNETVMREFTVIPMSFGTVFRSEDDV